MSIRVFHFSDNDSIDRFDPRPVRTSTPRKPGFDWLNGALVGAIDDWHQPMYLFPHDGHKLATINRLKRQITRTDSVNRIDPSELRQLPVLTIGFSNTANHPYHLFWIG